MTGATLQQDQRDIQPNLSGANEEPHTTANTQ